jgi:hypothetical protein
MKSLRRDLQHYERQQEKHRKIVEKYLQKVEMSSGKRRQNYEVKLQSAQEDLARFDSLVAETKVQYEHVIARKEEIMNRHDESFLTQKLQERVEPVSIMVRLMSGDILPVETCFQDWIPNFIDDFIAQHQYNPHIRNRIKFFVDSYTDVDHKGELLPFISEYSCKMRHWNDEFKTPGDLPILNMFISDEDDISRRSKLELIRKILSDKNLDDTKTDDEIYELYNTWHIHYQPPASSNRYTNLLAFIQQHSDIFNELSQDSILEKQLINKLREFRSWFNSDSTYIYNLQTNRPEYFAHHLAIVQEQIQQYLVTNPDDVVTKDVSGYWRHFMSLSDIVAYGISSHNLCNCKNDSCFVYNYDYYNEQCQQRNI